MFDLLDKIPKIPVSEWVDAFIDWLKVVLAAPFQFLREDFKTFLQDTVTDNLVKIPPEIIILIVVVAAFFLSGKRFGLPAFSLVGLVFVYNQGLWVELMQTLVLVVTASMISVLIGLPIGIMMSKSNKLEKTITPILDLMQTMPSFVYLIPAVAFFSIGIVPGIFATLIFATPPTVRFTNLAIRQVSDELIEAAEAFGSTPFQKLFKLELPMAKRTIMAGINQTVMLSLSMVVIASMIGTPGLGKEVQEALSRNLAGPGFVSGFCIVILAIIFDRFTQSLNKQEGSY
ncbi:ABC transporter permease [Salirhabdus salicampi]|uniref:ABC transporter permease n=1 Tax=Salirhabdus salicampi TaxID=476102 RepID=UPI0020C1C7D2|nr:proline/glycine betaine ABC transporter permease [Salirhabdus salicampi]MCP8615509.1 proline/glycine betaine ABC transporter permease [Salirhabdus salicampi]